MSQTYFTRATKRKLPGYEEEVSNQTIIKTIMIQ